MQGGGVGPGENSPFGTQFGWYATLLQNALAKNWRTAGIDARTQTAPAMVRFRIMKDGSLAPGLTKVSQSSGNRALDDSAVRAVLDSAPFGPLPQGFPYSQADCEFSFELRH
jgi:protein TonB